MSKPRQTRLPLKSPKNVDAEKERMKKEKAALKKLEMEAKIEETKRTLLRDYLTRELKYSMYTFRRHNLDWRKMLTSLTLPKQREELELARQTFERLMDAKDFIISCLMDEIRDAEDQYMLNLRMNVYSVDRFLSMICDTLRQLEEDYSSQLQLLDNQDGQNFQRAIDAQNTCTEYLKTMSFGMETLDKDRERNLRADYCSKMEFATCYHDSLMLELRGKLEKPFEGMWKRINNTLDHYRKRNSSFANEYDSLKLTDDKNQELLTSELKKLNRLIKVIAKLRNKEEGNNQSELENMRTDMKFFRNAFLVLKQKLAADLRIDKFKHEFLIAEYYAVSNEMERTLKLGENMIKLVGACKRLETSDEKVRPYPFRRHYGIDHNKEKNLLLFWQRIANIDASRTALVEETTYLVRENAGLMQKIEQACHCLSCPKLPPICMKEGPVPFTDGLTMMKKYDMQRALRRR